MGMVWFMTFLTQILHSQTGMVHILLDVFTAYQWQRHTHKIKE